MFKLLAIGVLGLLIASDQVIPRLADRQIREHGELEAAIPEFIPGLERLNERSDRECRLQYIYIFYAYQICFQPYTSSDDQSSAEFHLVYHRPKPKLSFLMPANNEDSFYFKELAQGEFILFVRRDGEIQYGDAR